MGSDVVSMEVTKKTRAKGRGSPVIEFSKPRVIHNIGNCIVTSLIACIAAEIMDHLIVPLTSQCALKQMPNPNDATIAAWKKRNFDDYAHMMALSLRDAEDDQVKQGLGKDGLVSGGIGQDPFYFILSPIEGLIEHIDVYKRSECETAYVEKIQKLRYDLMDLMLKNGLEVSRRPLYRSPLSHEERLSKVKSQLAKYTDKIKTIKVNSKKWLATTRRIKRLQRSILNIGDTPSSTRSITT